MKRINPRILIVIIHDLVASILAWLLAYWMRFNLDIPTEHFSTAILVLPFVMAIQAILFWRFGLYQGIWRFASIPDLRRIMLAVGVAALAIPAIITLVQPDQVIPRSVLLMNPVLLVFIMGGSRMAYRAWKEHSLIRVLEPAAVPVLVAGAGNSANALLRELHRHAGRWRVLGLFDDSEFRIGRSIQGIRVLGNLSEIVSHAKRLEVKDVVMAMPSAPHEVRHKIANSLAKARINVLTVPATDDLMSGRVSVSQLRPIELDDLLGRDPVALDDAGLVDLLSGHTILVTGAGGSIGSELCRQIVRFGPAHLVLFEQSEFVLYQMEQELATEFPLLKISYVIGDIKHSDRISSVMAEYKPSLVFHAAAYKHVPLMENENAMQALRNNVLGTYVCARAAVENGVGKFVMISTDKAVNPTNVMGASKRLAEIVCESCQGDGATQFLSVRFGNVLGSSGSVIPKFKEQIAAGGPVTVTHAEIRRYFMSIPEAAQLVLQAGLMGKGGEIFVLDMGEPVKISDLAKLMIRLSGHKEGEIEVVYTGLRPGEKLYEELLADAETTLETPHAKLRIAKARHIEEGMVAEMIDWVSSTPNAEDALVRERLQQWVPEYVPQQN